MTRREIVVLLTDFGTSDPYVAVMKGVLLTRLKSPILVDLTHDIEPQNILEASLRLQDAAPYFPQGTTFLCVVDPGVGTGRRLLAAEAGEHFFVGPDNGLLWSVLAGSKISRAVVLDEKRIKLPGRTSSTFHGRDIMAPAAALLAAGTPLSRLGKEAGHLMKLEEPRPVLERNRLSGEILYFDRFGNAITNIRSKDLSRKKRNFSVFCRSRNLGAVSETYGSSAEANSLMALWNSTDRLELAVPGGSARKKGRLKKGDKVYLRYEK